jgi:undecaprenyl-diphosphatase
MLLLGIVQGIAEFLPISSSGHLALIQNFAELGEASLVEDIVLHGATLLAVVLYYRNSLAELLVGILRDHPGARRYALLIVLANIPAAIVGLTLKDQIEGLFGQPLVVYSAFLVTGWVLFRNRAAVAQQGSTLDFARVDWKSAILVGCAQAVAILPGASRSGWTISVALRCGLPPAEAARFSFLLSLPAIAGAMLLSVGDLESVEAGMGPLALGFVASAVVGYFCLGWLVRLTRQMSLHRFSWYLWAAGISGFVIHFLRQG